MITGAASGIGLALTKACLARGLKVVMADKAATNLEKQVEQLKCHPQNKVLSVVCDVSNRDDVENLARETLLHFKRIDWLYNNAGISGPLAPLWELTQEQIRQVIDINLFGVIHGIQIFLPQMFKQQHPSQIINMASLYGLCSGSQMAAYAMSKHAIVALSESLHFDLQRLQKNVTVAVVCPSFADTELLANSSPIAHDPLHQLFKNLISRSRSAEDIAEHIIKEVERGVFYILPDREVKEYCQQRTQAIVEQSSPHQHSIEKIINSLCKRADASIKKNIIL